MSLELGGKNKSILYLNMVKSGKEANNDPSQDEICTVSSRFANQPFVSDQSKYLCAVTRFSVPLIQVHTIAKTGFDVYMYSAEDITAINAVYPDKVDGSDKAFFDLIESDEVNELDGADPDDATLKDRFRVARVDIDASFSFYEFLEKVSRALTTTTIPASYDTDANGPSPDPTSGDPTVLQALAASPADPATGEKLHPLAARTTVLG